MALYITRAVLYCIHAADSRSQTFIARTVREASRAPVADIDVVCYCRWLLDSALRSGNVLLSVAKPCESSNGSWATAETRRLSRGASGKGGRIRRASGQRIAPVGVAPGEKTPSPTQSRTSLHEDDLFAPSLGGRRGLEQSVVSGTAEAAAAIARSSTSETALGSKVALRVNDCYPILSFSVLININDLCFLCLEEASTQDASY